MERIIKSGYLNKRGGAKREAASVLRTFSSMSWKRRYFQFDGKHMVYYRSLEELERLGEFDLSGSFEVVSAEESMKIKYCLEIITKASGSFYVYAESRQEAVDWMNVLTEVSKQRQTTSNSSAHASPAHGGSPAHSTSPAASPLPSPMIDDDLDDGDVESGVLVSPEELQYAVKNATLKGRLYKVGSRTNKFKMWKRRWFVLHGAHLYYMKNLEDNRPLGMIELSKCVDIRSAEVDTNVLNSFAIVLPARTYFCYSESNREREEWLIALKKACSEHSANQTRPSSSAASSNPTSPTLSAKSSVSMENIPDINRANSPTSPPANNSRRVSSESTASPRASRFFTTRGSTDSDTESVSSVSSNRKSKRLTTQVPIPEQNTLAPFLEDLDEFSDFEDDEDDDDDEDEDDDDDDGDADGIDALQGPGITRVRGLSMLELQQQVEPPSPSSSKTPATASSTAVNPSMPGKAESKASVDETTTLFRLNSVASKVMKKYSELVGTEYLNSVLRGPLEELCKNPSQMEIDPGRISSDENLEQNQERLRQVCNRFLTSILNSRTSMPPQLNVVCRLLHDTVASRFPTAAGQAVGGFLFLRFFCPVIAMPTNGGFKENEFGLSFSDAVLKRVLILVTKVLQNLANGVEFGGKELFMTPINSFIQTNLPVIAAYYDKFSSAQNDGVLLDSLDASVPTSPSSMMSTWASLLADKLRLAEELDPKLNEKLGQNVSTQLRQLLAKPNSEITEPIIDMISLSEDMRLPQAVCSVAGNIDIDKVAEAFVGVFGQRKQGLRLLKWVIKDEVNGTGATSKVFDLPAVMQRRASVRPQQSKARYSGYLRKIGGSIKTWHRRWFVLTDDSLSYYKSPEETIPLHVIDLITCLSVRADDSKPRDAESGYLFEVITQGRTFRFAAESAAERTQWISNIKKPVDQHMEKRAKRASKAPNAEDETDTLGFLHIPSYELRNRQTVDKQMFTLSKEGWLVKKGGQVKSWKRRYFALRIGYIFYFKDEYETEAIGHIDLEHCYRVASAEAMLGESNSFEVVTAGRTYYLIAENEQEMKSWVDKLNQVVHFFRPTLVASAPSGKDIQMQGWLAKEGVANKAWRNRWFVLRGHTLSYFKTREQSATETMASGAIALEGASILILEGHRFNFCFRILKGERVYNLVAKDRQELEKWHQAISDAISTCALNLPVAATKDGNFLQKSKNAIFTKLNMKIQKPTLHVPASDASTESAMSGWLMKASRGHQDKALAVTSWQQRFFVLKNHCFYYYKAASDSEAIGVIELDDAKADHISESSEATALLGKMKAETFMGAEWAQGYGDALRNKWGFVVTTRRKKYFFITAQPQLARNWLDAIKKSEAEWTEFLSKTGIPQSKLSNKDTAKVVAKIVRSRAPTIPLTQPAPPTQQDGVVGETTILNDPELEELLSSLDDVLADLDKDGQDGSDDELSDNETS